MTLKVILAMLVPWLAHCQTARTGAHSPSSSLSMSLPSRNHLGEAQKKLLTGFRITITADDPSCAATQVVQNEWQAFPTAFQVSAKCSYLVAAELGQWQAQDRSLSAVYYDSKISETEKGTKVPAADLNGKKTVPIKVHVFVTEAGKREGFDNISGLGGSADGSVFEQQIEWRIIEPRNPRRDVPAGTVLEDIVSRLDPKHGKLYDSQDMITWGHETMHGVHADLRNAHLELGNFRNAVYALRGRYVVFPEPRFPKLRIIEFIPAAFRRTAWHRKNPKLELRYDTYVTSSHWLDAPLYMWDEWFSYINGAFVAIDLVEKNILTRRRATIDGPLELMTFSIAAAMATEKLTPTYLEDNPAFFKILGYGIEKTAEVYRKGNKMPLIQSELADEYMRLVATDPAGETMRAFLRRHFDAAWLQSTLGFH